MAKAYAKRFYKSTAWKKCRKSFIAERVTIDGGLCQHCKEKLGYIVDHKEEITPMNINDPNITLNHDNLQYLCLADHNGKTFSKDQGVRDGLAFDDDGNLIKVGDEQQI